MAQHTIPRAAEGQPRDKTETYLLHIRNILGWMLAIWLLAILAGICVGITVAVNAHSASSGISSCQSLGGTDPSC